MFHFHLIEIERTGFLRSAFLLGWDRESQDVILAFLELPDFQRNSLFPRWRPEKLEQLLESAHDTY